MGSKSAGNGAPTVSSSGGDFDNSSKTNSSQPTAHAGDVLVWYERSDEKWIQQAADAFNKQHPDAHIVLNWKGSREGKDDILYKKGKPVLWNPADTYWASKLNEDWQKEHKTDIVDQSKTILTTKLVLVMGKDRAVKFEAAMKKPQYKQKTWKLMADLLKDGWSKIGGSSEWGKLRLAQSNPEKSNSGMTALSLMFAEYKQTDSSARTDSPGFLSLMKGVEHSANGSFADSTSKALDSFLQNRSQFDIAICYETNAFNAVATASDIKVIYPEPTVDVRFPIALLKESWVTSEKTQRAKDFVDYLKTNDVQKSSIQYGFRPAETMDREVSDSFSAKSGSGLSNSPATIDPHFENGVYADLIFQWHQMFGGK